MNTLERSIREISERELALALVLEYAEMDTISFSLMGFYDDDFAFLQGLAERLNVPHDDAFKNKLRKVVRHLVNYGVLHARMAGTAKEYVDEPAKQMNYSLKPGKARLIQRGKTDYTMEPEDEAAYLLDTPIPKTDTRSNPP